VRRAACGGDTFTIGGTYDDELVRVGDDWRIAGRTLSRTWEDGNPAVMGKG
jgi:hypothetical protein